MDQMPLNKNVKKKLYGFISINLWPIDLKKYLLKQNKTATSYTPLRECWNQILSSAHILA